MSEIISKAMNSTLGTSNFKAFDELLLDSKSIVPGDDAVIKFSDTSDYWYIRYTIPKTETEIAHFTMPLSGTVNFRYSLQSGKDGSNAYLYVYVNGTNYTTISNDDTQWDDEADSLPISAKRGDVITIKGKSSANDPPSDGVTKYFFQARLYDIRYKVVDSPALFMTKSTVV